MPLYFSRPHATDCQPPLAASFADIAYFAFFLFVFFDEFRPPSLMPPLPSFRILIRFLRAFFELPFSERHKDVFID